jgi:hypothetical protein
MRREQIAATGEKDPAEHLLTGAIRHRGETFCLDTNAISDRLLDPNGVWLPPKATNLLGNKIPKPSLNLLKAEGRRAEFIRG